MGQNSIALILDIDTGIVPTVYSYYLKTSSLSQIFIPSDIAKQQRGGLLTEIKFDCVFAPNANQIEDVPDMSAKIYKDILDYAFSKYQIVVIDTQVLESLSVSKRKLLKQIVSSVNDLLIPIIASENGWILGVVNGVKETSINMRERIKRINTTKKLILFNMIRNFGVEKAKKLIKLYPSDVMPIGFVSDIQEIENEFNNGNIPINNLILRKPINRILKTVTGINEFEEKLTKQKSSNNFKKTSMQKQNKGFIGKIMQILKEGWNKVNKLNRDKEIATLKREKAYN